MEKIIIELNCNESCLQFRSVLCSANSKTTKCDDDEAMPYLLISQQSQDFHMNDDDGRRAEEPILAAIAMDEREKGVKRVEMNGATLMGRIRKLSSFTSVFFSHFLSIIIQFNTQQ